MIDRLKEFRKKHGLTQPELAKSLDLSSSYIKGLETGKNPVNQKLLTGLKEKYNVSADWLLFGESDKSVALNSLLRCSRELYDNLYAEQDILTFDTQMMLIRDKAILSNSPSLYAFSEDFIYSMSLRDKMLQLEKEESKAITNTDLNTAVTVNVEKGILLNYLIFILRLLFRGYSHISDEHDLYKAIDSYKEDEQNEFINGVKLYLSNKNGAKTILNKYNLLYKENSPK